jgi:hypothetical protein
MKPHIAASSAFMYMVQSEVLCHSQTTTSGNPTGILCVAHQSCAHTPNERTEPLPILHEATSCSACVVLNYTCSISI